MSRCAEVIGESDEVSTKKPRQKSRSKEQASKSRFKNPTRQKGNAGTGGGVATLSVTHRREGTRVASGQIYVNTVGIRTGGVTR